MIDSQAPFGMIHDLVKPIITIKAFYMYDARFALAHGRHVALEVNAFLLALLDVSLSRS